MWLRRDKHEIVRRLLSAYIDGELSSQEKALVEEHLRECAQCRWELETLRHTVAILREAPRVALPRSFVIRRADVEEAPAPSRVPAFLRVVTALGVAIFVLIVGLHFLMQALLPGMPAPVAKAPLPERRQEAVEKAPTVVVELEQRFTPAVTEEVVVTKEVSREVFAPTVIGKGIPRAPTDKVGVEPQALSPLPTTTVVGPVALAPSPMPKPAALPTSTPAPAIHPTPLPGPKFTTVLRIEPTPTPIPLYSQLTGRVASGWIWVIAALVLAGIGIGLWVYYRSKRKG
ncbi:MAG TPA: hypothetical protein ENG33_02980 [Chloroflexi bacterium]|nr:hypothetical protein [Chloroflexota bacterium]